jgi:hypothetical protein
VRAGTWVTVSSGRSQLKPVIPVWTPRVHRPLSPLPGPFDLAIVEDSPQETPPTSRAPYHELVACVRSNPGARVTLSSWSLFGALPTVQAAVERLLKGLGAVVEVADGARDPAMDDASEAIGVVAWAEEALRKGAADGFAASLPNDPDALLGMLAVVESLAQVGIPAPHVVQLLGEKLSKSGASA